MMDHQYKLLLLPTTVYADIHFASTQNQPQNPMNWTSPGSRRRSRPFMWKRSKAQEKMPVRRRQQGVEVDLKRLADERYDGSFFGRNDVTATFICCTWKRVPRLRLRWINKEQSSKVIKAIHVRDDFQIHTDHRIRCLEKHGWRNKFVNVSFPITPRYLASQGRIRKQQLLSVANLGRDEGIQLQQCSCSTWIFFTKCWSFKQTHIGGNRVVCCLWVHLTQFHARPTIQVGRGERRRTCSRWLTGNKWK